MIGLGAAMVNQMWVITPGPCGVEDLLGGARRDRPAIAIAARAVVARLLQRLVILRAGVLRDAASPWTRSAFVRWRGVWRPTSLPGRLGIFFGLSMSVRRLPALTRNSSPVLCATALREQFNHTGRREQAGTQADIPILFCADFSKQVFDSMPACNMWKKDDIERG